MIRIAVFRDRRGRVVGFKASGHSGWAAKGSDIVCAGVAALTQGAVLGLIHHVKADVETAADDGFLECRVVGFGSGDSAGPGRATAEAAAQAVLETMVLGLREIARQYPDHVRMEETQEQGAVVKPGPRRRGGTEP